jgi:hypothetical protein
VSVPSCSCPVPDSAVRPDTNNLSRPASGPEAGKACPTEDESRPGPVLARHSSEGPFPRAFLDETTCPVPVPQPSFPFVRPLQRGRPDLRVPSHRWCLDRTRPEDYHATAGGSLPLLKKIPTPGGFFSGARRHLSPERTMTVSRREIPGSLDKRALWHLRAGRVHSSSAPRADEPARNESLCSSCHTRPIRPRSVFYARRILSVRR